MSQNISLREIKPSAYLSYRQDGLVDIFIGLGILVFGIGMLTDQLYIVGIFPALLVPLWTSAKRSITAPRMGNVGFSPAQWAKGSMTVGILLGIGMLALTRVVGIVVFRSRSTANISPGLLAWVTWLKEYHMLAFGLLGAFVMSVGASLSGFSRLYAYAALTVVVFACGYMLNASLPLSVVLVGIVMLLSGVGVLIQFLQQYPIPRDK